MEIINTQRAEFKDPMKIKVNVINSLILRNCLHTLTSRGQRNPWNHCSSMGSNRGSKDFISIPTGSQGAVTCRGEITVTYPLLNRSCWTMLEAVCHMLRVKLVTSVNMSCQFWDSVVNSDRAPCCWTVSKGPSRGCRPSGNPHEICFWLFC